MALMLRLWLLAAGLAAVSTRCPIPPSNANWIQWVQNGTKCYMWTAKWRGSMLRKVYKYNFRDARVACRSWGARLVSIHKKEKDQLVSGLLAFQRRAWIGYRRGLNKDIFKWTDGTTGNYTNWFQDRVPPLSRGKVCVFTNRVYNVGKWGEQDCSYRYPAVCHINAIRSG